MRKDWKDMSREEKGKTIKQIITLFEDDEKITKIAYDHVELPVEVVHNVIMNYLELIDKIDEMIETL